MMSRTWVPRVFAAGLLGWLSVGAATQPILAIPTVAGPIATTARSHPFLHADQALDRVGYVEEEFFLSGSANVYDWTGEGHAVKVIAGPGAYTNRILVRRPKDAAAFSGNIEVHVLNATLKHDAGTFSDFAGQTKAGDVWIGVTSKPINVGALQRFDPARYAPLEWDNPAPVATRCKDPTFYPVYMTRGDSTMMRVFGWLGMIPQTSWPETEDGLVWDVLSELGLLLKSDAREKILPGFAKPALFMTGISQSSILIHSYVAAFHGLHRLPDGGPIYDGYLSIVGPALARLSQCSTDIPLKDARQILETPDVPFISLYSEGEFWISKYTYQPDAFSARGGIVTYEIAGAAHSRGEIPGVDKPVSWMPSDEDLAKTGISATSMHVMSRLVRGFNEETNFYWAPIHRAAYHNLKQWARGGVRPPQAGRLKVTKDLELERDAHGNAIDGVRMPYVDVPIAGYRGSVSGGGIGSLVGIMKPLPKDELQRLYPDRAAYVSKFSAATDKLLAERWILPEDANLMKRAADRTEF